MTSSTTSSTGDSIRAPPPRRRTRAAPPPPPRRRGRRRQVLRVLVRAAEAEAQLDRHRAQIDAPRDDRPHRHAQILERRAHRRRDRERRTRRRAPRPCAPSVRTPPGGCGARLIAVSPPLGDADGGDVEVGLLAPRDLVGAGLQRQRLVAAAHHLGGDRPVPAADEVPAGDVESHLPVADARAARAA